MSFLASMGIMNNALQPVFKRARAVSNAGYDTGKADINKYYDLASGYQQPYYDFGTTALKNFQDWQTNGGTSDPSYTWRLNQGLEAVNNSDAARGGALSGNALRGVTDYAQNAASQEYQNQFNRYLQQLGIGTSAAANLSNLSAAHGNALAGLDVGQGNQWYNQTLQSAQEIRNAEMNLNSLVQSWVPAQYGGGKQTPSTGSTTSYPDSGGNFYNSQTYANAYNPGGGMTSGNSYSTGYPSANNYQYSYGPQWSFDSRQYNNQNPYGSDWSMARSWR